MELSGITLITIFIVSIYGSLAQDKKIELTVSYGILYKKVGDKLVLNCHTNQMANFLITNPVVWEKVGRDGSKMKITSLANVVEGLKEKYTINLPASEAGMTFNLQVKNGVTFEDDGHYRCKMENNGNVLAEAQTEIVVLKNMDKMTFAIGGTELDTISSRAEPIYLEEGDYIPVCKTMGSNPASVIRMYLNGVEIGADQSLVSAKDTNRKDPPQVFNTEKKVNLKLTPQHRNQILKCASSVHDDPAMKGEISFQLDIFSVDPIITCDNSSAVNGDKWVELKCSIKLKGIKCSNNMESILWENSDSGEQYKVSTKDARYTVFCEDVGDGEVKTTFRVKQVTEADFKSDFFVVFINKHNTTKRKLVPLDQKFSEFTSELPSIHVVPQKDYNSATGIKYAVFLLCFSLLSAVFL